MFDNGSVMALVNEGNESSVYLLEIDQATQSAICTTFAEAASPLFDKEVVRFNGSYKPEEDEILSISEFQLPKMITNAVKEPLGLQSLAYKEEAGPNIDALFVGECTEVDNSERFTVALQRFRKEQYLSTKKYSLYFDKNTFVRENRWGIGITDNIDCVFSHSELRFSSYFYARQIFDLSEYYRSATDSEVQNFSKLDLLDFTDPTQFLSMADTWIRRKIASINDSGILATNTAAKIKKIAKKSGFEFEIKNEKILMPTDKKRIKELLGFLDEEVYKGAFSKNTYITNSKRKMN